ncbi:hypothetical protein JXB28_02380 [Candidatus Woesearchaeota archaeon]|nr:hypothetical protein [Candidatus Woesearchaeota archaeon]
MLEDKLRNIKDEVVKILEQREMEQDEYFNTVHDLLRKEGLAKGKYSIENMGLAVSVGESIRVKVKAEMHTGIHKRYVSLKDKELSIEAEHDVRSLNSLVEYTGRHIRQQTQGKPIKEHEFSRMIESYISSQKLIPITDGSAMAWAIGGAIARLENYFDVIKEPVKYGGIDKHDLYEALKNI